MQAGLRRSSWLGGRPEAVAFTAVRPVHGRFEQKRDGTNLTETSILVLQVPTKPWSKQGAGLKGFK